MEAAQTRHQQLEKAFDRQELFEAKTWLLSPAPWQMSAKEQSHLQKIGEACREFYIAQERLYRRSVEGANLLRNGELKAPWVAEYLDRGKPEGLVEHARHPVLKRSFPKIIRPDLLVTENGYALTELDAVPGGIGLTAYLYQVYKELGVFEADAASDMVERFYRTITAGCEVQGERLPVVAIVVNEEAATYRPEFQWLAASLREYGYPIYCIEPENIMPMGGTLCTPVDGSPEKIDVIYRFFELFDLRHVSTVDAILNAVEKEEVVITPPMRHFQEEKLSLALFHHHLLDEYWRENLSKQSYNLLKKMIPNTWIVDPVDLPPNAILDAPYVQAKPITDWRQLAKASQKERKLILKISGYHADAWGARSVVLGSDVSREEWEAAIEEAIQESPYHLRVLQEYRKPVRLTHEVYDQNGEIRNMSGRLRLCPFYFVEEETAHMPGALATFCPADKKIIHGMQDAAMLPVAFQSA